MRTLSELFSGATSRVRGRAKSASNLLSTAFSRKSSQKAASSRMASLPTTPLVSSSRADSFYTSPPDTAVSFPYRTPITSTAVSGSTPVSPVPSSPSSGTLSVWSGPSSTGGVSSASTYMSTSPPSTGLRKVYPLPRTGFSPTATRTVADSSTYGDPAYASYLSSPRSFPISPGYHASFDPVSPAPFTPPITGIVSRSLPSRESTYFQPSGLSPLHSPGPSGFMSYASSYNGLTSPIPSQYSGDHVEGSLNWTDQPSILDSRTFHPSSEAFGSPPGTPPPSY